MRFQFFQDNNVVFSSYHTYFNFLTANLRKNNDYDIYHRLGYQYQEFYLIKSQKIIIPLYHYKCRFRFRHTD